MPQEHRFHGKLTFEEYLECHRILAAKRRIILRTIVIFGGLFFLIKGVAGDPGDPTRIGIGIAALVYATIISPLQFRYRVKRLWQRNPSVQKGMDITVVEDGLRITDDKGQPFHKDWTSFHQFREIPSLFLLYLSPLSPLCLPKRLIPAGDLPAARALLSSSIPSAETNRHEDKSDEQPPRQVRPDKDQLLRIHAAALHRMASRKSLVLEPELLESAIRDEGLTPGQVSSRAQELLGGSADRLAPDEIEALLTLATDLYGTNDGVSILNRLLLLRNHMKHEDIVRALQDAADVSSVPFLAEAITMDLDYLSWDENKALARKCFWALAAIGTSEAWQVITRHTVSGDPVLAQWADEQIKRRQPSGI